MIRQLFASLEGEGIAHAVWKGSGGLADALAGRKDIDLLVGQRHGVAEVLRSLGFKRVLAQPWTADPHVEDWVGIDPDSAALVHVHLYFELVAGQRFASEYLLPWKETLLSGARRSEDFGIDVCDPNLEILLLGVRIAFAAAPTPVAAFGRPRTMAALREKLSDLRRRVDESSVSEYASDLLGRDVGRECAGIIVRGDLGAPEVQGRLRAIVLRALSPHRRYGSFRTAGMQLSRGCRALVARAKRRVGLFSQTKKRMEGPGAIVAIIGSDGAGKSTVARELVRWLRWKVDAHAVYLGSGDGRVGIPVKVLKALASRSKPSTQNVATHEPRSPADNRARKRSAAKEVGACLLALAIGRERLGKVRRAHRERRKGSVLITDRFPQRQYRGIYDGPRLDRSEGAPALRRYFGRLEERIYRKIEDLSPDLVVRLHVPATVALQRKPDHSEAEIRRKADLTRQIEFPGARLVDIDASAPLEEVLRSVKQVVWASL